MTINFIMLVSPEELLTSSNRTVCSAHPAIPPPAPTLHLPCERPHGRCDSMRRWNPFSKGTILQQLGTCQSHPAAWEPDIEERGDPSASS